MSTSLQDESFPPNKSHYVGEPRTHFRNPWPSYKQHGALDLFKTRFGSDRNFVPVPPNREGLVPIRTPDWGAESDPQNEKLKATWIGHASWLVETPATSAPPQVPEIQAAQDGSDTNPEGVEEVEKAHTASADPNIAHTRGIRLLLDPVFSERTSPFSFIGPKRYTPTPCAINDLPEVDLVCISHNHYDHLDGDTVKELAAKSQRTHFLCALGLKDFFIGQGVSPDRVTECDWWEAVECQVEGVGTMRLVCTPAQHFSARWINDQGKTLWCSWAMGSIDSSVTTIADSAAAPENEVLVRTCSLPLDAVEAASTFLQAPRLYFAGDTGYRTVPVPNPTPEETEQQPHCPVFSTIGTLLGPFDLALLPIGLFLPRNIMSPVHCCPEDSVCVARDVGAKRSIGMHYGTVRGGLSGQYEDVREPPRRWKEACEQAGLKWGEEAGLCDIGETVTT